MVREAYIERKFSKHKLAIIAQANKIIAEYQRNNIDMTVRMLYYQFVARGIFPNTLKMYALLTSCINKGRLAGLVDWDAIEDRVREYKELPHWGTPSQIVADAARWYEVSRWDEHRDRPEVWIEKDALIGVIQGVCHEYDVPYFACRGYNSQSHAWRAGKRCLERYHDKGQLTTIFHLGDHDPSGIDMTRDNDQRLEMFAPDCVVVKRLALNMDQIRHHKPPPNPAKMTDSRSGDYVSRFGTQSWELDALDPKVIVELLRQNIVRMIDPKLWKKAEAKTKAGKKYLHELAIKVAKEAK